MPLATSVTTLDTTEPSVPVTARWAPITSLFRRLVSAPVWVRVKNDDRHALHVVEQRHAQVVDQALADARGQVALAQRQAGVGQGATHDERGEEVEQAAVAVGDGVVEDLAEQQRRRRG